MERVEKIFISGGNVQLEAEICDFKNQTNGILLCHPHPQFGGNMHNNVTSGLFNSLSENNVSCMRFNFRGVGSSTGNHTHGSGEIEDVKSCVDFLINDLDKGRVLICGYSYGAAIGSSVVNYSEKIVGFIAISFPFEFMGPKYVKSSNSTKFKLFIQGDRDSIAPFKDFKGFYEKFLEPKEFVLISGADHFYWGYERQISSEVIKYIKSRLKWD